MVRIWEIPGTEITGLKDIERLIETPLVNAITILFEKGIETYWCTANKHNPFAIISIEPKHLSPANILFAKAKLGFTEEDDSNVMLQMSITPKTPVSEVDEYFVDLAKQFKDQK